MNWQNNRPPDWEKRHWVYPYNPDEIYEAGADALLKKLREQGVRITEKTQMVTQPIFERANGYLVFIPDEKTATFYEDLERHLQDDKFALAFADESRLLDKIIGRTKYSRWRRLWRIYYRFMPARFTGM